MKPSIRIVTDSSSDLAPEEVERHQIQVVPLTVNFGTEVYQDRELPVEAFWQKAGDPHLPQTSQPSVGAFEQVFEPLVAEGHEVLCVLLTGKHSGTCNAARVAGERFGGMVTVFDSHSLSLGLGYQAIVAARAAESGHSVGEIVRLLEDLRPRTELFIVLDTLEYLSHGGRAEAFMAAADRMTRALNIKLIINLVEGRLRLVGPSRSFERALRRVLDLVQDMGPLEALGVAHTRKVQVAQEMADRLAQRTEFPREQVWLRETGAVLASHAGPGVVGVMAVPSSED